MVGILKEFEEDENKKDAENQALKLRIMELENQLKETIANMEVEFKKNQEQFNELSESEATLRNLLQRTSERVKETYYDIQATLNNNEDTSDGSNASERPIIIVIDEDEDDEHKEDDDTEDRITEDVRVLVHSITLINHFNNFYLLQFNRLMKMMRIMKPWLHKRQ